MAVLVAAGAGIRPARALENLPKPPRVLFIAIDAVPFATMAESAGDERNGFLQSLRGPVPLISTFPSTTSLALAAILRPIGVDGSPGYEAKHYEWTSNRVSGGGLFDYEPFPWRSFFDWKVETLFRKAVSAIRPIKAARQDIRESLDAFLASDRPIYFVYYDTTDSAGHLKSPKGLLPILAELDHRLADARREHPDDPFWTVIFSDHGMDGGKGLANTRAAVERALREAGFRLRPSIGGDGDVVIVPFGLVSSFVVYTAVGSEDDAARAMTRAKGVDLCVTRTTDGFRVEAERGSAVIRRHPTDPPRWGYQWSGEDPLWLSPRLHAAFADGGSISDGELFAATVNDLYPDPFHRIASSFGEVENPASVVCSVARGHMYGAKITALGSRVSVGRLKWTHGALEYGASLGFLMSDVPSWRPLGPVRFDHALAPFTALWDGRGPRVEGAGSEPAAASQ
ncbi:MAG TPA: hypothetical protein VHR17_12195 [Thermoanaerobaculia bacterium]|nr:hypothetical protein [Thermoanaerobaculia bacterium]